MAKPQTVLVVDDDHNILMVVEARLASGGYEVRTAASGEEALRVLAKEPVDLILTDVRMPGMSGADLLERVLKDQPGMPVIVLTAHGSIPDSVEAIKAGAVDY
jgi:DNA-binding NtrC family response regulator